MGQATMARSKATATCGCPVAAFQKMVSGKYKLRIVWDLKDGPLIDRRDCGVVPPEVEYRLTAKGRSFVPIISAIRTWGTRHLAGG